MDFDEKDNFGHVDDKNEGMVEYDNKKDKKKMEVHCCTAMGVHSINQFSIVLMILIVGCVFRPRGNRRHQIQMVTYSMLWSGRKEHRLP